MDLVRIDTERVRTLVEVVLRDFPAVAGAYLFGSALGSCRPDSDIDLGIFVAPGLSDRERFFLEGAIALRLPPLFGHPFDLTIVDPAATIFAFRVLDDGIRVYVGDEDLLTDLMERISRDYAERGYRHGLAVQEILEEAAARAGRS